MTCTQAQLELKTMKENMLGKLMLAICKETALGEVALALVHVPAEMFGTLLDLVKKLADEKGEETWKNLKHLLRGEFEIKLPMLIRWLDTTTTSATTEKFVARDKFHKSSKEVKFYGFGDNFTKWFDGKIEEPIGEQTLRYGNLTKNSTDGPIIEELGGEEKAETTLAELYDLLKKQANGKGGDLLTNGYSNIFYIRDTGGALRAVGVHWRDVAWSVGAQQRGRPADGDAGRRVFSRNS